jgi:HK97 family phage prohead protease
MRREYKVFEFKVTKAESNSKIGYIEGYASTFGNVDLGQDVVDRGAFVKTIKDNKGVFPILIDHDPSKPFGWNLDASEDNYGLKVKGEVNLITEEQQNRYQLAKRAQELGTKMGLSIGYSTIKWENDHDRPEVRHLKELKLWEYSQVTFPMNPAATITQAKAAQWTNLFARLQDHGYDEEKLVTALAKLGTDLALLPAAKKETDPEIIQSVDKLTEMLRG